MDPAATAPPSSRAAGAVRWLRADLFLRSSAVFAALALASQALAYVYQVMAGRMLGPVEYGAFAALVGAVSWLDQALLATQMGVTHFVARWRRRDPERLAALLRAVWSASVVAGAAALLAIAAVSASLASAFDVSQPVVLLAGVAVALGGPLVVYVGALQGQQRFFATGAGGLASNAARLGIGLGLIASGFGVLGAVLGHLGRSATSVALAFALHGRLPPGGRARLGRALGDFARYALPLAGCLVGLVAMTTLDIVVVKLHFSDTEAGLYSGASVLGKVALLLPGAVGGVLFSMASSTAGEEPRARRLLARAVGITLLLSGSAALAYALVPGLIVRLLLGDAYQGTALLLPLFGLAMLLMAVVQVLVRYFLAIRDTRRALALTAVTSAGVLSVLVFHATLRQVILVVAASASVGLLVGMALLFLPRGRARQAEAGAGA